jgi:hypothetical protein
MGCEAGRWMELAQDCVQWRVMAPEIQLIFGRGVRKTYEQLYVVIYLPTMKLIKKHH